MKADIVEFPEVGKHYLVRRYVNGATSKQFEPALLVETTTDAAGVRKHLVKWVYDVPEEGDVEVMHELTDYCGLFKSLSEAQVLELYKKVAKESYVLRKRAEALNLLAVCMFKS